SHGLDITYTPLNVSMAIDCRRFSPGCSGTRSKTDRCGAIDPRALKTSTTLRRCGTYARGFVGWTATFRARLSDPTAVQVAVPLPVSTETACNFVVWNSPTYKVFSSGDRAIPRQPAPTEKVRATFRAATSISLTVPG